MTIPTPLLGILPPETNEQVRDLKNIFNEISKKRIITVDRTTGHMIAIRESKYNEYLSRGYFGFMINPEFGQGVYD